MIRIRVDRQPANRQSTGCLAKGRVLKFFEVLRDSDSAISNIWLKFEDLFSVSVFLVADIEVAYREMPQPYA
jgi:hypothetical protein